MATKPVDPKRNRVFVEFTVGGKKYAIKMANSNTQGSLFGTMGFTDKGEKPSEDAIRLSRSAAIENGLLVTMVAECSVGTRNSYKKIYVPTPKLEETVTQGPGKTIGNAKVSKVRGVRTRVLQ